MIVLALLLQLAATAGQIALPASAQGDFDRDGRPDVAAVERRVDGRGYDLVVRRGIGGSVTVAPLPDPRLIFLTVSPAGTLSYGPARGVQMLVRWADGRFTVARAAG